MLFYMFLENALGPKTSIKLCVRGNQHGLDVTCGKHLVAKIRRMNQGRASQLFMTRQKWTVEVAEGVDVSLLFGLWPVIDSRWRFNRDCRGQFGETREFLRRDSSSTTLLALTLGKTG